MIKIKIKLRLLILIHFFLVGCMDKPEDIEIIGDWIASTGSQISFFADSSFTAKSLPGEIFGGMDYSSLEFDGHGKWNIQKKRGIWEVHLNFDNTSLEKMHDKFFTSIFISEGLGEKYLFQWVRVPGGERFKFYKR